MKKFVAVVSILSGALILCASLAFISAVRRISFLEFTNATVTDAELRSFGILLVLLLSCIVLSECIHQYRSQQCKTSGPHGFITPVCSTIAWITGLLIVNSIGLLSPHARPMTSRGVSADGVLSPVAATAVLAHVIQRRREQLEDRFVPHVSTVEESEASLCVSEASKPDSLRSFAEREYVVTPDVQRVLSTDERKLQVSEQNFVVDLDPTWLIEVKLYGYPTVVAFDGTVAEFRKKRALELLTWLTLNRDRSRRSTARTALWDVDVSDSSFSTVVSDLRRGLRTAAANRESTEFLPTTYSDELLLSQLVTTDADRLQVAHARFKETHVVDDELRSVLKGMRDIPLAGTSYSWADLDGTTTRLVMCALSASVDVAHMSINNGELDDAMNAISAGLRVLPGCEELLELQQQCLSRVARPSR